ncbi:MAG: hypothetical protein HZC48_11690 [Nitrospirae bacterium]|nr:hypothetical protein [Nitrospirota bacterium]
MSNNISTLKTAFFLKSLVLFIIGISFSLLLPYTLIAAEMGDYCIIPPYVKRDVEPNIMIIMDNAENMEDRAYSGDYVKTKRYNGYYNPTLMYYNISNQWVPASSRPAGCTTPGCVYMSGNLLNWAVTSKFDLLEKILVGGKGIATNCQQSQTLDGRSNEWTAILNYIDENSQARTCYFYDGGGGTPTLVIRDNPDAGGSCGYLDTPDHPIPSDPQVSAIDLDTRVAENTLQEEKREKKSLLSMILTGILDALIPSADAAAPLRIDTGAITPNPGTECSSYSTTFTATGGSGTGYTWSIVGQTAGTNGCAAGRYPIAASDTGLCLTSGGVLSGIPKTSGNFPFTVRVTDSAGGTDTKAYTSSSGASKYLVISAVTLSIDTTSPLSDAVENTSYSNTLETNNVCSTGGYTWSISGQTAGTNGCAAGEYPISASNSGLCLNSTTGTISGTPTGDGPYPKTYSFTVNVTGYANHTASKAFSLTVKPCLSVVIITTSPLPDAAENNSYSTTISAICGTVPYQQWSIIGQTAGTFGCPAGKYPIVAANTGNPPLCLDPLPAAYLPNKTSAIISGTPTGDGPYPKTYTFIVEVIGGGGVHYQRTFELTVRPIPVRSSTPTNIRVCLGDYALNCNSAGSPYFDTGGLLQDIWTEARFGLITFGSRGEPTSRPNECIDIEPDDVMPSDFCASVRTATATDTTNALVDGEWTNVDYFAYEDSDSGGCQNPFNGTSVCARNFNLIISAGEGADTNADPDRVYSADNSYTVPSGCTDADYRKLTQNACFGQNTDLRSSPSFGADDMAGKQYVSTYVVNTMGTPKTDCDNPATPQKEECNPDDPTITTGDILWQAAKKGGGKYYEVTDPEQLEAQLKQAFQDMLARAASGTAASVLASGEGQGANIVQAVFYPQTQTTVQGGRFGEEIMWIGQLQNLWYYVDPFFQNSSIREETVVDNELDLTDDNIAEFYFDTVNEQTRAKTWPDADGDGNKDTVNPTGDVIFEALGNLWEAGKLLWQRDVSSDPRTIYTPHLSGGTEVGSTGLMHFTANTSTLRPYLNLPATDGSDPDALVDGDLDRDGDVDDDDATILVKYVHGFDFPNADYPSINWLRSRTTAVNLNPEINNDTDDVGEEAKVWKLGDIISSTAGISSWLPTNSYDQIYFDTSYGHFIKDLQDDGTPKAVSDKVYTDRGMVFAGANDGMLHAFNMGQLQMINQEDTIIPSTPAWVGANYASGDRAKLSGSNFGREVWAFIPKNSLPYLRYLTDTAYCHLYSVDLPPYIFDASISGLSTDVRTVDSWKTILIGGMRYGGACKNSGDACSTDLNGDGSVDDKDCVRTPVADNGYSSYFALDITDQENPKLLWEFSSPDLGFATAGPSIIRIGNSVQNGKWFAVFGSGPTGPIDTTAQQFLGNSDQDLKLFIFDIKTGPGVNNANVTEIDTNIPYAFAGSMMNITNDSDLNYNDEALYISYVKRAGSGTVLDPYSWTNGGIIRLVTQENQDPAEWDWSYVINDIGPVTSAIGKLQNDNKGILWIFFGTGRYFYEREAEVDDSAGQRRIFGIKEPCFTTATPHFNQACSSTVLFSDLTDVTDIADVPAESDANAAGFHGWFIDLDASGSYTYTEGDTNVARDYFAERMITDTKAATSGLVFFATYKPYNDVCGFGGKTFLWATRYNTGGSAGALLKGKVIVQVSTGSIEQIDLSEAFTEADGRKTAAIEGVPPTAQGLSILTSPPPVKRVIHIREK